MQTKKKIVAKNASKANHRSCRQQSKMASLTAKKDTELIASSAKKQRNVGIIQRKNNTQGARTVITSYDVSPVENEDICLVVENSLDNNPSKDSAAQRVTENIFSPTYHFSKDAGGDIMDRGDFTVFFRSKDHDVEDLNIDGIHFHPTIINPHDSGYNRTEAASCSCDDRSDSSPGSSQDSNKQFSHSHRLEVKLKYAHSSCDEEYADLGNISSEVSEIYLAMENSKLDCIDESNPKATITSSRVAAVVPRFRPMLLPKQTRSCPSTTLVLDLDETLVHSTLEPCKDADFTIPINFNMKDQTIYVRCRPHLKDFVERVSSLFEVIIFTASQSIYAGKLLNILDPKRRLFRHRVYRESCVFVEGNFLKDLSVLGRDLARVIIIDNSPQAFGFQVDNGIPIESWFDDRRDCELLLLLPFLESLVGVEDVRPVIAKRFNLREKVAAAASVY